MIRFGLLLYIIIFQIDFGIHGHWHFFDFIIIEKWYRKLIDDKAN